MTAFYLFFFFWIALRKVFEVCFVNLEMMCEVVLWNLISAFWENVKHVRTKLLCRQKLKY